MIEQAGRWFGRDPVPERFQGKLCGLRPALAGNVLPTIGLVRAESHKIANPNHETPTIDLPGAERRTPGWTTDHKPAQLPVFLAPFPQSPGVLDPDQRRSRLAWSPAPAPWAWLPQPVEPVQGQAMAAWEASLGL